MDQGDVRRRDNPLAAVPGIRHGQDRRREFLALAAVLILGLGLRLYRIDWQSGWSDELFSLTVSQQDFHSMTEATVKDFVNPPGYYYILHIWMSVFGRGMLEARLLSVLCGETAIVILFQLVKMWCGSRAGLLAATLLSLSQIAIAYSQEARTYSLTLMLSLCTVWLFVIALKHSRFWWSFVGCGLLLIYTHYYAVFVLLGLLAFGIIRRQQYGIRARHWIYALLFWAIGYLPWLTSGVIGEYRKGTKLTEVGRIFGVHWYTALTSIDTFNNGLWNGLDGSVPLWTYPAGFLLLTLPILVLITKEAFGPQRPQRESEIRTATQLFGMLWLIPMFGVLTLSAATRGQYVVRYLLIALAPYYALAAIALVEVTPRLLSRLVMFCFLLFSIGALRAYYFIPTKADYRGAMAYLNRSLQPGDCVGFAPARSLRIPRYWLFYGTQRTDNRLFQLEGSGDGVSQCGRLWVAWDAATKRSDPRVLDQLSEQLKPRFALVESEHFLKFDLSLWLKRP